MSQNDGQQSVDDQRPVDDQPTPAGPDGEDGQQEAPLTRAEFEALEARLTDQIKRRTQSRTDQASERLQRKFQELAGPYARAAQVAAAKGLIPADQQAAYARALRDDAIDHAFTQEVGQAPARNEPAADTQTPVEIEDINQQAEDLAQSLGLMDGDPELEHVIADQTPEEYFASIRIAARMKATRQSAAVAAGAARRPAPAGRSPGAGAGGGRVAGAQNPIANIESSEDLYAMAWNDMKRKGR